MKKSLILAIFAIATALSLQAFASETAVDVSVEPTFVEINAGTFKCPAPQQVRCKSYAESVGSWTQNGGYRLSTNTAFLPNNQCANVAKININGNNTRLFCCYKECGVLTLDLKFKECKKVTVSDFRCE